MLVFDARQGIDIRHPPGRREILRGLLSFRDVDKDPDVGDGRAVGAAYGLAHSPVPAVASVLRQQTVFHVIDLLTCVVGEGVVKRLQHPFFVVGVQQVGPGFQNVRKGLPAVVAQHSPELVAPFDLDHHALFIEIHGPFA